MGIHITPEGCIWAGIAIGVASLAGIIILDRIELYLDRKARNEPDEHTQGGIGA